MFIWLLFIHMLVIYFLFSLVFCFICCLIMFTLCTIQICISLSLLNYFEVLNNPSNDLFKWLSQILQQSWGIQFILKTNPSRNPQSNTHCSLSYDRISTTSRSEIEKEKGKIKETYYPTTVQSKSVMFVFLIRMAGMYTCSCVWLCVCVI